jgi:dTDP-4-amino-4,6-dideoxygalactose transaminase
MRVAQQRVRISQPIFGALEEEALLRVFRSGMWAGGAEVAALENEASSVLGVRHAIAVSSGTSALEAALIGLGIGAGDEVITSAFSFIATAEAIVRVGASPIFADIEPDTLNLSSEAVDALITPRTVAILPVHLYGRPCDMTALGILAERHGLAIVEDACQAIGASFRSRQTGSFGVGCFSFYGSKNITCGEGGMVTTNDDAIAIRIRRLRDHGTDGIAYRHLEVGTNWRMTDLQASLLRVQLTRLGAITTRRRDNAAYYHEQLATTPLRLPPCNDNDYQSVFHQFTIGVGDNKRDAVKDHLDTAGIEARIYYPTAIPEAPYLRNLGLKAGEHELPVSYRAAREVLSIPVHPGLGDSELGVVVEAVRDATHRLLI